MEKRNKYKLFYPKMDRSAITDNQGTFKGGKDTPGGRRASLEEGGGMGRVGRISIESLGSALGLEDSEEP